MAGSDGTASTAEGARAPGGVAELPQTKAEVRARREELRSALVDLEDVLSRPIGDASSWSERVQDRVEAMHTILQHHVRDTESEGGMLAQLEEDAPWLEGRVDLLRREHGQLLSRTDTLRAHCRAADSPEDIRDEALGLLQAVSRHRQRGTDLLYDAYMVDISAAD